MDDRDGFGHAAMSTEHAFAAQAKLRNFTAGLAQQTTRDRRMADGALSLESVVSAVVSMGFCFLRKLVAVQTNCNSTIEQSSTNSSRP